MKVWKLDFEVNKYKMLTLVDETNLLEKINSFDGRSKINQWEPILLKKTTKAGKKANTLGSHISMPIVDKKVLDLVEDLIGDSVEILPIIYEGEDYDKNNFYLINITEDLDCIDYAKSEYETFDDSEKIMWVTKFVFFEFALQGKHMFKAKGEPLRKIFVSDEFKERIINSKLKGFEFELAWDSNDVKASDKFKSDYKSNELRKEKEYQMLKRGELLKFPEDEFLICAMTWMWCKFNEDCDDYQVISSLPLPCQNIYSIFTVKGEVENGGFNQFYYNNDKRFGYMAERGFSAIGLVKLSDFMSAVNLKYEEICKKIERHEDDTIKDFMESYNDNPLNDMDKEFCEILYSEDFEEICIKYIKENAHFFGN